MKEEKGELSEFDDRISVRITPQERDRLNGALRKIREREDEPFGLTRFVKELVYLLPRKHVTDEDIEQLRSRIQRTRPRVVNR